MRAMYRCRLCGEEFCAYHVGKADAALLSVVFVNGNRDMLSAKSLLRACYPTTQHYCGRDRIGYAEFLGFKMEEDEMKGE